MKQKTTGGRGWVVGSFAAALLALPAHTAQGAGPTTPGGPCIKGGLATSATTPQTCLAQGGTWLVSLGGDRMSGPLYMGGDQLHAHGSARASIGASGGRSDLDASRFPTGDVETGDAGNALGGQAGTQPAVPISNAATAAPTSTPTGAMSGAGGPPSPGGAAGATGNQANGGTAGTASQANAGPTLGTTASQANAGAAGTAGNQPNVGAAGAAGNPANAGAVGERRDDAVTRQQVQEHQGTGHTGDMRGQGALGGIGSAPAGGAPGSAAGVSTGATGTAHGASHTAGSEQEEAH